MASISEGFPYAVIEAMLSAATIVSTDVGGVREALGDTGLLVRSSCPVELAEAILKLLLMPADERSQLGKRACDRALELFTLNRCMEEHLNSYQRLVIC